MLMKSMPESGSLGLTPSSPFFFVLYSSEPWTCNTLPFMSRRVFRKFEQFLLCSTQYLLEIHPNFQAPHLSQSPTPYLAQLVLERTVPETRKKPAGNKIRRDFPNPGLRLGNPPAVLSSAGVAAIFALATTGAAAAAAAVVDVDADAMASTPPTPPKRRHGEEEENEDGRERTGLGHRQQPEPHPTQESDDISSKGKKKVCLAASLKQMQ